MLVDNLPQVYKVTLNSLEVLKQTCPKNGVDVPAIALCAPVCGPVAEIEDLQPVSACGRTDVKRSNVDARQTDRSLVNPTALLVEVPVQYDR